MLESFENALFSACSQDRYMKLSSPLNPDKICEPEDRNPCTFFWSLFYVSPERKLYNDALEVIKTLNRELMEPQQNSHLIYANH